MKALTILAINMIPIFLFCNDPIKTKEAEINELEQNLKKKVSEYNNLIAQKHSKTTDSDTQKTETAEKTSKNEDQKKLPNHLNISSDPNILQEQVKQLQDTVEKLTHEVKELKENVVLKKKKEIKDATKKTAEEDTHIIEYTSSQAQFNAANAWFEKDTEEGYKKAIEAFAQVAQENCNHSISYSAYNKIGDAYRKLAKWDEAIKYYNLIIEQDNAKIHHRVDAMLGKADAEREKNDRVMACKTLDSLERSNLPMTQKQKELYQALIVSSDCASKKDHDVKEERGAKKEEKEGGQ
jgi:tetratricopeptide (TPR) repeat protein